MGRRGDGGNVLLMAREAAAQSESPAASAA